MNRKISVTAACVNGAAVVGFAIAMLAGSNWSSYFASLFIALSFVPLTASFCVSSKPGTKLAGYTAVGFAVLYATVNAIVYYTQLTAVQDGGLTAQATELLDFQQFGLFFSYDMLGYACMALATFFAGLTITVETKTDRWLKPLLLIHGIFFITCFIAPLLGLFSPGGPAWVGTAILLFWCAYFLPVDILCAIRFARQHKSTSPQA